jgi:hypothetical protein
MPRIPEDPPGFVLLEREGFIFAVGDEGGDFSWRDIDALKLQIERWNQRHQDPVKRIDNPMLRAVARVMRFFPGSMIEDFSI